MLRSTRTGLITLFGILLLSLATSSTVTGQTIGSAATSQTIQAASQDSCSDQLKTALERLDKTLDAYEKATMSILTRDQQIAAMKLLDQLKDQYLAVKDQLIAAQAQLIKFYEKKLNGPAGRFKKLLEIAEKILLIAGGVAIGHGL